MIKLLTVEEQEVIDTLTDAWNLFAELPVSHEYDRLEFMSFINGAQNIVLARPAMRSRNQEKDDE